jgi:hypothetical protein
MFFDEIKNILRGEPFPVNAFAAEDWPQFILELGNNNLLPFFYTYSQNHPHLPDNAVMAAKKHYEDALIIKDYSLAFLKEIQADLSRIGRIVTIKGCALSEHIYREPAVRPMGDIDIYLPDGAINEVAAVFNKNGFSRYGSYENVLSNGKIHIDLHEDLWNARRIPSRRDIVSGIPETFVPSSLIPGFFIPSPELLAAHTAFHCIKHNFSRLIWALDLRLLYMAGYFTDITEGNDHPFVPYALEWLAVRGFIDVQFIPSTGLSGIKRSLLNTVTGMRHKTGFGEIALTLFCPSPAATIRYLATSLFPPEHILKEMYGNKPFLWLLLQRFFELFRHALGALLWTKK